MRLRRLNCPNGDIGYDSAAFGQDDSIAGERAAANATLAYSRCTPAFVLFDV